MWKLLQCKHKKLSPPTIRRRADNVINRMQHTYVTCLDCKEQFPYSLSEARRVYERRHQREDMGPVQARAAQVKSDGDTTSSKSRKSSGTGTGSSGATAAALSGVTNPYASTAAAEAGSTPQPPARRHASPPNSIPMHSPPAVDAASVTALHKLAYFYHAQKNYEQAERLYIQALAAAESAARTQGGEHSEFEKLLNNLANVYHRLGKFTEAESLYSRSLEIVQKQFGEFHPKVVRRLLSLAELNADSGNTSDALQLYQQAMLIAERELNPANPEMAKVLTGYSALLRKANLISDAEALEARHAVPAIAKG
jgi:hypothetical protein